MLPIKSSDVDFLEAGHGPLVVLVHSSVSGARQWRKLIELLARSYHVKAVNLFGYGRTPSWGAVRSQTLADQAALIEAVVPEKATNVGLVGHSFGASVAMCAAAHLGSRASRLMLLEPNPFYLLRDNGRMEAFGEAAKLRDIVKHTVLEANGSLGQKNSQTIGAEMVRGRPWYQTAAQPSSKL